MLKVERGAEVQHQLKSRYAGDSLTDSVRLSFVNGFSGALLVLNARPRQSDTLVGRVFESRDYGPPFEVPRGGAKAVQIPCAT